MSLGGGRFLWRQFLPSIKDVPFCNFAFPMPGILWCSCVGAPVHALCAILDFMVESVLPLFIHLCVLIFNMNLRILFLLVVHLCFSDLRTLCPNLVFCLLT